MLRYQINQLNQININNNNINGYMNLYEELQKLKDDNEKLRKDTICLLQNKKC